jgi:hypothetical protein
MWSLNRPAAWRAALGRCAPSPQACHQTPAPGRAAGGLLRGFMLQAQAAKQRLKHGSAPPRSFGQRLELVEGTSPRGLTYHCTNKAGNICSVPLYICRVVLLLLIVCPRQGRRRPTPKFCTAGAGGVTSVEICVSIAAKLRPTPRTRRRYIAAIVTLPLCR